MRTYQDLQYAGPRERDRMSFVEMAIASHKDSAMYRIAADAEEYARQNNVTIMQYQKILYSVTGQAVVDKYSPNHKIASNFFDRFVTQENQYLLGNGMSLESEENKEKLGKGFDRALQELGRDALVEGVSFGFWNFDHLEVFRLTEFVPLYDEETGALMAGVRYFQISPDKPLRATLYEPDGYTEYIRRPGDSMTVLQDKQPYIRTVAQSEADGVEIIAGYNYQSFPIIPLWGNPHKQSELVGLRQSIDAYDLIKSGFANDLDGAIVYWVLKNAGGMDDIDVAAFMDRLRTTAVALADDDITPQEIPIPYESRVAYLERLEQDMYNDFQAFNVTAISAAAKTATEITAAYQPFDNKVDQYEYCILTFLDRLFALIGIDDNPSFTRNKVAAQSDDVKTLLMCADYFDDEYMIRRLTAILGDPDAAQAILDRRAAGDLDRMMSDE